MTMFKERETSYEFDVSDRPRTATVPWHLGFGGDPIEMRIPAGARLHYDEQKQILHMHDPKTGLSHTVTPHLQMFINLDESFYELTFIDPNQPHHTLPGLFILDGNLTFEDKEVFDFTNSEMFAAFCRVMAHPLFNPWAEPLPRCSEYAILQYDIGAKTITIHEKFNHERAVDDARCKVVTGLLETKAPLKGEERRGGKVALPPALYDFSVAKCDGSSGEPLILHLTGTGAACAEFDRVNVVIDAVDELYKNQKAEFFDVLNRVFFDPRVHVERTLGTLKSSVDI